MRVIIDGMAWLPKEDLGADNVARLRKILTVQPRQTSEFGGTPDKICLYLERGGMIGIPRGFYTESKRMDHAEEIAVSYGDPMQEIPQAVLFDGPFAEQEEALRALESKIVGGRPYGQGILQAGCGFGKGLRHGEPVITPFGEIPIEEIKVGDLVIGVDGKPHPVVGVFPQGVKKIYRLTFTDGTHVDCDEDHLWTFHLRRERGRVVTMSVRELLGEKLRMKSGRRFFLPVVEPIDFGRDVRLPMDPYTLGVILGDGCIGCGNGVRITTQDHEIIDLIEFDCKKVGDIDYRVIGCAEAFKSMGLYGHRSYEKFVPEDFLFSGVDERLSLLQGLFDTDGSFVAGDCVEYSTSSRRLADCVRWLVCSIGGTCRVSSRIPEYTYNGERRRGRPSYRLFVKLPHGMKPFRLGRRLARMQGRRQREPYRALDSIELVGEDFSTCIRVDAPWDLFLTRNAVPTHNTVVSIEFARRLGLRTMILVHKEFFLRQWRERIEQFAPGARIGIVRQDRCEFEDRDFVIGLVQSIARDDGGKYPDLLYQSFGLLIVDETHRIAAPTWAPLAPKFKAAYRLGLTATPRRKDGAEDVFIHHLGAVAYRAKTEAMVPKIRTLRLPARLKPERMRGKRVHPDDLPQSKVMSQLAGDKFRTREISDEILMAVRRGRKVMVVSERLEQLRQIYLHLIDVFPKVDGLKRRPTVAPYTGEWFTGEVTPSGKRKRRPLKEDDLRRAESANVILATKQMVEEGLDIPALDVIIFATPMSDVEQAVGRVRRFCEPKPEKCAHLCPWRAGECQGKRDAIVTDIVDMGSGLCEAKYEKRKRFYRQIGALGGGQHHLPFVRKPRGSRP